MADVPEYNPDTFEKEEYKHIMALIDRRNWLARIDKETNSLKRLQKQEYEALNWVLNLLEEISTE